MHHTWMYTGMAGTDLRKIQKHLQETKISVFVHLEGSVTLLHSPLCPIRSDRAKRGIKQAKKME